MKLVCRHWRKDTEQWWWNALSKLRPPENISIFEGLSALHPNKVLSQPDPLPFSQLPLSFLKGRHMHQMKEQYKKLFCWLGKTTYFQAAYFQTQQNFGSVWENTKILQEKALDKVALSCLLLPVLNSVVEWIFLTKTLTKTAWSNWMKLRMLQ